VRTVIFHKMFDFNHRKQRSFRFPNSLEFQINIQSLFYHENMNVVYDIEIKK